MLWGEWEAQSRVADRYPDASTGMPRFVHEPFVQRPSDMGAERQNTDPFVFGETFLYSNCRQFTPDEQPSRLQRLSPGSVILFGSTLERRFVLDTVLVVGSATRYVIGEPGSFDGGIPAAFRAATLEPLAAARKLIGVSAHLYQGVMHGPEQQELKLSPKQIQVARSMYEALGDDGKRLHTVQEIADVLKVSRRTIYSYLQQEVSA
jgi:DNA-binding CsgD family transcriptional regulator